MDYVVEKNVNPEISTVIKEIAYKVMTKNYDSFVLLGKGDEGIVFGYDDFAIKISLNEEKPLNDALFLKNLDDHPLFPKLYAYSEHFMIVERVHGKTLGEQGLLSLEQLRFFPEELKSMFLNAIDLCFEKLIAPHDLHLNNFMLDQKTKLLKIIDVGKFSFIPKDYVEQAKWSYMHDCKAYQSMHF